MGAKSGRFGAAGCIFDRLHLAAVEDERDFSQMWEHFRLEGGYPEMDWSRDAVLFFGTGESGSCPLQFFGVSRHEGRALNSAAASLTFMPNAHLWAKQRFR
ncbi:MAG: hypothetical protein WD535_02890 [Thermaerobacterales bacterium]